MKIYLFVVALYSAIVGFVVAFIKEYLVPKTSFDHSGLKSFVEKIQNVAVEVTLRLNAYLSGLQHSPTA